MKCWFKALFLIALFATSFFVITDDAMAHKAGGTFQAWAAVAPTIDANIGEDEWKYAATKEFDLGGGYTGTLYFMNDANNLYIAAKVVDDNFENGTFPGTDTLLLYFDNDHDGVFSEDGDEYLYISSGILTDGFIAVPGGLTVDTSDGGTEDGSGAMANGAMENLFEVSHPLDSADNEHDFSLATGSTVGFRIRYFDGDGAGFTGYWPGSIGSEFGDIVIASAPPTLSAFASTAPVIDGAVDTAVEWVDAATVSINFGWTYSGTIYVMNDAQNLYIAAKISDVDLTGGDFLVILFDNNNDGIGREDGDDHLQLVGSSAFSDNFYQSSSLGIDTADGGTEDGDAEASGDGSFNYYEFQHPLNSTDDSHDFSLSDGSTVGFELQYRDGTTTYWGDWPSTSAASWAKITMASAPDFSINADPLLISVAKGATGSSTITVASIGGFSDAVALSHSWFGDAPSDVTITLPEPITPPPSGSATSELQVSAGGSATTGNFTLRVTGSNGGTSHQVDVDVEITEVVTTTTTATTATTETTSATTGTTGTTTTAAPPPSSGCLIVTAAYGSEISGEVQFLRSFRDESVMKTFAGSNFIKAFNSFYYSFSPSVAKLISQSQVLRSLTRIFLYPLIGTLYLSSLIFNPLSFSPELAVLASGFIASLLIGAVYLFPIAAIVFVIVKRRGYAIRNCKIEWLVLATVAGLLVMAFGELMSLGAPIMIGSALFVVSTIGASGISLATKVVRRL